MRLKMIAMKVRCILINSESILCGTSTCEKMAYKEDAPLIHRSGEVSSTSIAEVCVCMHVRVRECVRVRCVYCVC